MRAFDTRPGVPVMIDILGVAGLLVLPASGTWLALRARRARKRVVKWVGLGLSSLIALAGIVAVGVALRGFYRVNFPPYRGIVPDIHVAGTPDQVARGARFGAFCAGCHSTGGKPPLVGQNFTAGGPPFGTLWAPNLTPAGEIAHWSDGEVIRAIREGVHKSGRALVIMPSEVFRHLSDADAEAIVAYLRSQPAAGASSPPTRLNVLAAFLLGAGIAPTSAQPPVTHPIVAPAEGVSAEHGKYLVSVLACRLCHGENLTGGKRGGPGPPAGPNLTVILAKWAVEDFIHTMRTGIDPYNHTLAEGMPWKAISAFASDTDLKAMFVYLHGLTTMNGQVPVAAVPASPPDTVEPRDSTAPYVPIPLSPPAIRIPEARGLTIVSAFHSEDGDRENSVMIGEVSPQGVTYTWKYKDHRGTEETGEDELVRVVSANDLARAPRLNSLFRRGAGVEETPGYTAMTISRASFNQVHDAGEIPYTIKAQPKGSGGLNVLISSLVTLKGTLSMAAAAPESVSVLVNGERTSLPALHLRGRFDFQDDHREADYWVLADSVQPLILRVAAGVRSFQTVRIEFPVDNNPPEQRVERELEQDCRAELPGIYFAFASAELQPASEPALTGVADLLARHPDWSLGIEGHTDSIGDPESNRKLSMARAEAVRVELVQHHPIAPDRLHAAGFGAAIPRESNATLEGRARNRRVELTRCKR